MIYIRESGSTLIKPQINFSPVTLSGLFKCTHGLSVGSCMACSGGIGSRPSALQKKFEMSWDECYSIGLFLKARLQSTRAKLLIGENLSGAPVQINPFNGELLKALLKVVFSFLPPKFQSDELKEPLSLLGFSKSNITQKVQNRINPFLIFVKETYLGCKNILSVLISQIATFWKGSQAFKERLKEDIKSAIKKLQKKLKIMAHLIETVDFPLKFLQIQRNKL